MAYLVVFRGPRLTQVIHLASPKIELIVRAGHLEPPPAAGAPAPPSAADSGAVRLPDLRALGPRISVAAFGGSCEIKALPPLMLSVDGKESERKLLRAGDAVEVSGLRLHFSSDAPVEAPRPPPSRRWMDALVLLANRIHSSTEPGQLLESVMDGLMELCHAQRGFLLLAGEDGELELAVSRKLRRSDTDHFSRTVVKQALDEQRPILVADASQDPTLRAQQSVVTEKLRSIVAAPLLRGDRALGAVYLDRSASESLFSPEDVALLQAAAAHVVAALANSGERERLRSDQSRLRAVVESEVRREHDVHRIVGAGPSMQRLMETARKVAAQDISTLILGESGTGKELLARAIHDMSGRRSGPFVAVNCMALAPELMESELFGHEKGAFTGANDRRAGRFELAEGGTIFLDEIGELDHRTQVRLLRVLQERVVERVGGHKPIPIDIRLVCATHVDMEKAVEAGRFREDLYYRIAVFPLLIPPLRERPEDVPALAEHFIRMFREQRGRAIKGLTREAADVLARYPWPGNVRELKNVIERAFVLESSDMLTPSALPLSPRTRDSGVFSLPKPDAARRWPVPDRGHLIPAREAFERAFILDCLERNAQNVSRAAKELGVPRSTIYRRLDRATDPEDD